MNWLSEAHSIWWDVFLSLEEGRGVGLTVEVSTSTECARPS